MEVIATRSAAGIGLVMVLFVGGWVSSRMTLDTAEAVKIALAKRVDPEQAQRTALAQTGSYHSSEEFYQTTIDDAVKRYELTAPSLERLLEPNTFFDVVSPGAPRTVTPDAPLELAGIEIRVKIEEIDTERRGMRTRNEHTLSVLTNVSATPLAYFVRMRSRAGDCKVRALTRYNTMVLLPDETAEVSICSGVHEVEITDLRVMEVSELGARWLSKVPPQAVGHDELASRSHNPGDGVEICTELAAVESARQIEAGDAKWEDIVDFYSRHDCDHYRWVPAYQRITTALASLPVLADE